MKAYSSVITLVILLTGCLYTMAQDTPTAESAAAAPIWVTPTPAPSPTPVFAVGSELTIETLRQMEIVGSAIAFEQTLVSGSNYARYIASYTSEGYKIYGLLTVPFGDVPEGGFKAIVFNHGYIPPETYVTTERYVDYVGTLAENGFVVFKIDMRGHGDSEGEPTGSYFSPAYTIDAITALKSLQMLDFVDPDGIGMWGHSMAGNLVLRAMLIEPDIKAGVIWAGAVYSYDDFTRYSIDDPSARGRFNANNNAEESPGRRRSREIFETYGRPDLAQPYWLAVSLTAHLNLLNSPLQLHHALDDTVVNVGYSVDLSAALTAAGKTHDLNTYEGGGHNIAAPYFHDAMARTVAFFKANL